MSKKIISFTTCLFFFSYILLFPTLARGSEKVATVKQGERAPFTGTLFNTEAAARLLADLETNKKWCEIEADRKLGIQKTEMQLKIDILQASRDSLQIRHDEIIKIKNGQIDYLEKKYVRLETEHLELKNSLKNPLVKLVLDVPTHKTQEMRDRIKMSRF